MAYNGQPQGESATYYNSTPNNGYNNGYNNGGYNNNAPPPQYQSKPQPYQADPEANPQPQQFNMEKPEFDQMFALKGPKYHDIWCGLLFLACFAGFVAVSGLSIHGYASTKSSNGNGIYDSDNTFGLTTNTLICMLIVIGIATVFSILYMAVARVFTKQLIWITGILNICMGLATAIYMLYRKYYSGGIVFLIFSVFSIICFVSWIPRIPWSVLMLQTSIDVSRRYGHVYLASLIGGLAAAAFSVWYSVTMVAVYVKYEPGDNAACSVSGGSCSQGKVIGLMVFITFAGYWITEWLKNTLHATIAGIYGSWYFSPNHPASGATRHAFRRSMTYSFGSISLGSLLVAIINFLRQLCSVAQQSAANDGNIMGTIFFCILGCFISILDWCVQFINRYAFIHIALYGSPYFTAAKNTWSMIKNRGIDALVSQCLISPVFGMGSTFVAYATALTSYVFLKVTDPAYNSDGSFTPVVVAFSFLIGLQICNVFTTPVSSGVDTIFVAMAWDPRVMVEQHPELYQDMIRVYPQVQQACHT